MRSPTNGRREKAILEYYKDPKRCAGCHEIMHIRGKESVAARRKHSFCGLSCTAKYAMARRWEPNTSEVPRYIPKYRRENFDAKVNTLPFKTKGEVTEQRIRHHARLVYRAKHGAQPPCVMCGYLLYTDVCHIKPIRDHSDDAKLFEINTADNLIGLCPNHHWEFDNNVLSLETLREQKRNRDLAREHGVFYFLDQSSAVQ